MASDNNISSNLVTQYYEWINSDQDVQPGAGLNLDNFAIIGGDLNTRLVAGGDDGIVPINDEDAIYGNINIPNPGIKRHFEWPASHVGLVNEFWVGSIITKTLNKEEFNFLENLGKKDEQINP